MIAREAAARRVARGRRLKGAAILCLALASPAFAAEDLAAPCAIALDPAPRWTSSGAWSSEGDEVVLVDILGSRLLRYSSRGGFLGDVRKPGRGRLEFNHPTKLTTDGAGFVLMDRMEHLLWLDEELEPRRAMRLPEDLDLAGVDRLTLSDFQVVGDDLAALVAVVRTAPGSPGKQSGKQREDVWRGYAVISREAGTLRQLVELSQRPEARRLYGYVFPLVATAGGVAYGLDFGPPNRIVALLPSGRALSAIPEDLVDELPELPGDGGPGTAVVAFAALEGQAMVTGLYGRGDKLYLLARRPGREGTLWQLHRIAPDGPRQERTVTLPSTANHLFLVPGVPAWAIVEKGPVEGPGEQTIDRMILLPAGTIEGEQPLPARVTTMCR